ncbi:histone-lysine N-methyltransferase SETMAR [Trichonephila clavipes]|nr:histone-lysine N-methyltransferase SETMAR [Trichonephila clavipes]
MYPPLLNMEASNKEQRGVIRFLAAEGVRSCEMHRRMKAVYGEYSLCRLSVVEWRKKDSLRSTSYWKTMLDLDGLIVSSHRNGVRKLSVEQRNTRMELSLSHLQRYHEKKFGFLSQIVTGDETWCVQAWIRQQPTSFFKDRIDRLVSQWDKWAKRFDDYI